MKLQVLLLTVVVWMTFSSLSAQIIVDIEAGGGPDPTDPYYSPQFVEIEVGDMVRWTNSGGTHNVDGTTETFPDNPQGFTTGDPSNALWVFTHTFILPGLYNFECSAYDHNETQYGTVTVSEPTVDIAEYPEIGLTLYPNPASTMLHITTDVPMDVISIHSMDMKRIGSELLMSGTVKAGIPLQEFENGHYLISIVYGGKRVLRKFVVAR